MQHTPKTIFISYNAKDEANYAELVKHINDYYNFDEIYFAIKSNKQNEPWEPQLQKALTECICLIIIIGSNWELSKWITHELATAYRRGISVFSFFLEKDRSFNEEELKANAKKHFECLRKAYPGKEEYDHEESWIDKIVEFQKNHNLTIKKGEGYKNFEDLLISEFKVLPQNSSILTLGPLLPKNQDFTDRKTVLISLARIIVFRHKSLTNRLSNEIRSHDFVRNTARSFLIRGIPGVGKTQVISEFCYRFGRFFDGLCYFDLDAVDWHTQKDCNTYFNAEINNRIATLEYQSFGDFIDVKRNWVEKNWLVIVDNVKGIEDASKIKEFFDNNFVSTVIYIPLIEFDDPSIVPEENTFYLDCFEKEDSEDFLGKTMPPDNLLLYVECLGNLPLALTIFRHKWDKIVTHQRKKVYLENALSSIPLDSLRIDNHTCSQTKHIMSLLDTFDKRYQYVCSKNNKYVRMLFQMACFCCPVEKIPDEIFVQEGLFDDLDEYETAFSLLRSIGFFTIQGSTYFKIHRLIAEYGRSQVDSLSFLVTLADVFGKVEKENPCFLNEKQEFSINCLQSVLNYMRNWRNDGTYSTVIQQLEKSIKNITSP